MRLLLFIDLFKVVVAVVAAEVVVVIVKEEQIFIEQLLCTKHNSEHIVCIILVNFLIFIYKTIIVSTLQMRKLRHRS